MPRKTVALQVISGRLGLGRREQQEEVMAFGVPAVMCGVVICFETAGVLAQR